MPSYRAHKAKAWHARAKRKELEYSLGYYRTKEEAIEAEERFRRWHPPKADHRGVHQR